MVSAKEKDMGFHSLTSSRAPMSSQDTSGMVANPSRVALGCTLVNAYHNIHRLSAGNTPIRVEEYAYICEIFSSNCEAFQLSL